MPPQPPMGSPPGPTEEMRRNPPQMGGSRPDINMARSNTRATFNDAENMESNFASVNEKERKCADQMILEIFFQD